MRITTTDKTGAQEFRELDKVTTNNYGDICLSLNRGERWQFTPKKRECWTIVHDPTVKPFGQTRQMQTDFPDAIKPEEVEFVEFSQGIHGDAVLILRNPERVIYGMLSIEPEPTAPTTAAKTEATPTAQTDPGELERLRAFAQLGKADAVMAFCSQFGTLPESVIVAGWLKAKGKTWAEIQKKTKCSKSTLHGRLEKFYKATGWPKADRRKGIGKTYQLDESRDAGSTETEL